MSVETPHNKIDVETKQKKMSAETTLNKIDVETKLKNVRLNNSEYNHH